MSTGVNHLGRNSRPRINSQLFNQAEQFSTKPVKHDVSFFQNNQPVRMSEKYSARTGIARLQVKLQNLHPPKPLPKNQKDSFYDGCYVGANGETYPAQTRLDRIPRFQPAPGMNHQAESGETIIYVNGICTPLGVEARNMQAVANWTGAQVIGIHNSTEGAIQDLGQCIQDKLDVGNNLAVNTMTDTIYSELMAGRQVHVMGHSQGGLILARSLQRVYTMLRQSGLSDEETQNKMVNIKCEEMNTSVSAYLDR